MALYASVIGLLLWRPSSPGTLKFRSASVAFASITAAGAAVWFIGLQVFALGHLCPYCLIAHTCGLLLAITVLRNPPLALARLKQVAVAAAASVAVMIGIQLTNEKPVTYEVIEHSEGVAPVNATSTDALRQGDTILFEAPDSTAVITSPTDSVKTAHAPIDSLGWIVASVMNPAILVQSEISATSPAPETQHRKVRVLGGVELVAADWPMIGDPSAEMIFVELFDYTCPHCQRTHAALNGARQHFGDRLAVLTLPVPLDGKCNPTVRTTHASHSEACDLAKLAVAVWKVDRAQFEHFHEYLFKAKPRYSQALNRARELVDSSKLDEVLRGSLPSDYIGKHVALYQHAGGGKIPKMMFPTSTTVGAVDNSQSFIQLIQTHFNNR